MSHWFHIRGMVTVEPFGRSQPEKRYILESVLNHLPVVQGSEGGMMVSIIQRPGFDVSSSHDEYDCQTDNGINTYDPDIRSRRNGWYQTQSEYILVLDGDLRDVYWDEGIKMLTKWLCRLSSRMFMNDIMLKCYDGWYEKVFNNYRPFYEMMVEPSWYSNGKTTNWFEHLAWKNEDNPYDQESNEK